MGIGCGTCQRILTADQKQQHVSVCKELCQIACEQPSSPGLSLATRAGFTVMTLRQCNNPLNGKIRTHQD
jgi:hypothetical protein